MLDQNKFLDFLQKNPNIKVKKSGFIDNIFVPFCLEETNLSTYELWPIKTSASLSGSLLRVHLSYNQSTETIFQTQIPKYIEHVLSHMSDDKEYSTEMIIYLINNNLA